MTVKCLLDSTLDFNGLNHGRKHLFLLKSKSILSERAPAQKYSNNLPPAPCFVRVGIFLPRTQSKCVRRTVSLKVYSFDSIALHMDGLNQIPQTQWRVMFNGAEVTLQRLLGEKTGLVLRWCLHVKTLLLFLPCSNLDCIHVQYVNMLTCWHGAKLLNCCHWNRNIFKRYFRLHIVWFKCEFKRDVVYASCNLIYSTCTAISNSRIGGLSENTAAGSFYKWFQDSSPVSTHSLTQFLNNNWAKQLELANRFLLGPRSHYSLNTLRIMKVGQRSVGMENCAVGVQWAVANFCLNP